MLITGASRGIGAEIARMAIENYNLILVYNNSEENAFALKNELQQKGNVLLLKADLRKSKEVNVMVEKGLSFFKKIDVLVNCAGISEQKLFTDLTDEDWHQMFASNLDSAFFVTRAVLPQMISRQSGAVVNITSMWGETGASMETHYSASKAGLIGLTKALAKEVALSNVTVNAVSCGAIMTDMMKKLGEETIELVRQETPLQKIGTPSDVAKAVLFLAENEFVTGQILGVNGGFLI